ncbi:MAG: hypothetical protein MJK04_34315 [Psychrosphaera sp.]|nr:hypothetical protein [Psychrosphaera sp.]
MNPFEAIVIIAVVAIIASVIKNKRKHPNADDHNDHNDYNDQDEDTGVSQQMQLELMALRKRVEALEAIVTDKSYNLKREIDDL